MSLIGGLLGNASEVDTRQLQTEYATLLLPDEEIQRAYQLIRDRFLFTTWRLIMVDRKGMTGLRVEYHSLPYKAITHFAVETAGKWDLDAVLIIWLSGNPIPFRKRFNRKVNVYDVQRVLAHYVLYSGGSARPNDVPEEAHGLIDSAESHQPGKGPQVAE